MSEQKTAKKRALSLLNDDHFLKNFKSEVLAEYHIVPWEAKMGPKETLFRLHQGQCDLLLVDNSLEYSLENLACWLAALKEGGMLALESNPQITLEALVDKLSGIAVKVTNPNLNVWLLAKMPSEMDYQQYYAQIATLLADDNMLEALKISQKMDLMFPHNFNATYIQSKLFYSLGMLNEVERVWQTFLARSPSAQNSYFYTLDKIAAGDYQQGFKERALLKINDRTQFPPPKAVESKQWKGQSLYNKSLVIWSEFGLGDEIMFSQLAYYLSTLGTKKITLLAQTPIVSLLQTHPDITQVIDIKQVKEELGDFDYWVYPHDILAFIDAPFVDVPKRLPYLFPRQADIDKYNDLFKPSERLKVGIVWRGGSTHENDIYRSLHNLEEVQALFQLENIDWYCFQKVCNDDEKAMLAKFDIPNVTEQFTTMYETAAALQHVDYLLTVDTSVAHIAGATGVPTLLLLPFFVDWRWGHARSDNMWYQNMMSFRNHGPTPSWDSTLAKVVEYLRVAQYAKAQFG